MYRCELDKEDRSGPVAANGPLILDDLDFVFCAAIDGPGFAFMPEDRAAHYVTEGSFEQVIEDWVRPIRDSSCIT